MKGIEANARIWRGQDSDLVFKNMKLKNLRQPHDEVLITTDSRYKHYKAIEDRINLKGGLIFRKNLEKRVVSNTTNFSFQSNYPMMYSVACIENLENTQELPEQKLLTEKNFISQKWRINQGVGHVM